MVKDYKETFHTGFAHNVFFAARQAIRRHASGGNVLIFATVAALVVANIPALTGYYSSFWTQEVRLQLGDFNVFSHRRCSSSSTTLSWRSFSSPSGWR